MGGIMGGMGGAPRNGGRIGVYDIRLPFQLPHIDNGNENPVLKGFRFTLDRSRDGTSYWKCCLHKTHTCKARMTTVDKQLTSSVPEHTHDVPGT
jgi:hypothetical protein